MPFCSNCGANNADGSYTCVSCGSSLSSNNGLGVADFGSPFMNTSSTPMTASDSDKGKGLAIASLIFSITGFILAIPTLGLLGLIAVVLGILARVKGSKSGMATAGIILGALTVVLMIISIVILVVCGIGIVGLAIYLIELINDFMNNWVYYLEAFLSNYIGDFAYYLDDIFKIAMNWILTFLI